MDKSFLEAISSEFDDILTDKLISLLLIGSVLKADTTPFSDLDLIMVLKDVSINDLEKIRKVLKSKERLIDLVIMSLSEIPKDPADFQMGTHGCYFIEVLRSAELLHGNNIFLEYGPPSVEAIKESIFRKLAEYNWYARRMFAEANRERSIYQNYQLSSRLLKAVKDMLRIYDFEVASLCTKETIKLLFENFKSDFSEKEQQTLMQMIDPEASNQLAANMTEDFLITRVGIMEILYQKSVKKIHRLKPPRT